MKRFDPMDDEMIQFPEGEWVRYSDAVAEVAAERERLAQELDELARRLVSKRFAEDIDRKTAGFLEYCAKRFREV